MLPKRLIEVDLPIKRISAHARHEKDVRHGHISTLHIWWARRPLAACRAVVCAALWPDPADPLCPEGFRQTARQQMNKWVQNNLRSLSSESLKRFVGYQKDPSALDSDEELRNALLDFIADFSNWDNSTAHEFLETSRVLTQSAHISLGGAPGTNPLVVDPFAGGGSIPLEALRVGANAFASDLNPVSVLLNKVILEYIPKYGQQLVDEVRRCGTWIKEEADRELADFYPKDTDGASAIAYLWARTITCEGPGCGAELPLMRTLWLAKKSNHSIALKLVPKPDLKRVDFQIIEKRNGVWEHRSDPQKKEDKPSFEGTVRRGSATCPCCGYTTPVAHVREQLKSRHGGADSARLFCVVTKRPGQQGRHYRLPYPKDEEAVRRAEEELAKREATISSGDSLVPNEPLDVRGIRRVQVPNYGMSNWGNLFTRRQALALQTLSRLVGEACGRFADPSDTGLYVAVRVCLALSVSKEADLTNSLTRWKPDAECPVNLFARQAVPIVWEFAEAVATSDSSGSWTSMVERTALSIEALHFNPKSEAFVTQSSATSHPLPDDAADAFITDPPYYDAITYSYLSDFFYVWLRRILKGTVEGLFKDSVVPKDQEIIVDPPHESSRSHKTIEFYESELRKAFTEGRRILADSGIGTIVFASKTTASWEAILKATIDAGWIITASWPIDTEMATKVAAIGQARLMSSVHLVCRPRPTQSGSVSDEVGDWRDVLAALPPRMHQWMPRLAKEGVVGADAIFACLGPALEIFSRYSRVEKANGQVVSLSEYLEQVWAAVSKEALTMVFEGADASGFEEDARLTAMWLWTLSAGENGNDDVSGEESDSDDESAPSGSAPKGYILEYDAARKIAQGLGAHLESLASLVEVKGEIARLLPVAERTRRLFAKDESESPTSTRKKKTPQLQLGFVEELEQVEQAGEWGTKGAPEQGATVLDRVHQSMILFAAGRGEALRRFLVDDGVGRDERFWRLAQVLSFLYPKTSDEKRWIDGVLARKKGLGF
jgi:putative DNA methylase